MAKVVSLINMRGGVGRSTLTVALAHHFASQAKNVLVVDLDPQAGASHCALGRDRYTREVGATRHPAAGDSLAQSDPANGTINVVSYGPARARLDLLPSRTDTASRVDDRPEVLDGLERFIERALDRYELILVDCAAALSAPSEPPRHA